MTTQDNVRSEDFAGAMKRMHIKFCCKCCTPIITVLSICICLIAVVGGSIGLYYLFLYTYDGSSEGNRVYYKVFSHNDYLAEDPLTGALKSHVGYMEVDCHLVDGVFMIGHDTEDLEDGFTLSDSYLNVLLQRDTDDGTIWGGNYAQNIANYSINIVLEKKDSGTKYDFYWVLDALIRANYESLVSYYDYNASGRVDGNVNIILIGSGWISMLQNVSGHANGRRYLSYQQGINDFIGSMDSIPGWDITDSSFEVSDLNISDLEDIISTAIYAPLIGASWGSITDVDTDSDLSSTENIILTNILKMCQFLGIRMRNNWASPLDPGWDLIDGLLELDVDYDSYSVDTYFYSAVVEYIELYGY